MENKVIDTAFAKHIKQLIANDLLEDLQQELQAMYPQDVAELLNKLDKNDSRQVMV